MEENPVAGIEFEGDLMQQVRCRLMLAFATMAAVRGKHEDADLVFKALEPYVRNRGAFVLHRATALAIAGAADVAVEMMSALLDEDPDDDLVKVAKGVAMLLADNPDWQFVVDNVLATSIDQAARQAALKTITYVPAMLRRSKGRRASIRPA